MRLFLFFLLLFPLPLFGVLFDKYLFVSSFGFEEAYPHKPIEIVGDDGFTRSNGVVRGSGSQSDPYVIENWVINAKGYDYGIRVVNTTKYFVIRNCLVYGSFRYGIYLYNVSNALVTDNRVENNTYGLYMYLTSNSTIIYNNVSGNNYGVYIAYSHDNVLVGNNIVKNTDYGVYLINSYNNIIVYNNFIGNTQQVYSMRSSTTWDTGYPGGGNYWSEHDHTDQYSGASQDQPGGDGICDLPYQIYDTGYNIFQQDHYPFTTPIKPHTIKTIPKPQPTRTQTTWGTTTTQIHETTTHSETSSNKTPTETTSGETWFTTIAVALIILIIIVATTITIYRKR